MPVKHRFNGAVGMMRTNFGLADRLQQSQVFGAKSSIPSASYVPTAWVLPKTAGAISSRNMVQGSGAIGSFALVAGRNLSANVTGTGDLAGVAQLIISLAAAISGSSSVSAELRAFLLLSASLAGQGDMNGAATALGHAAAAIQGEGDASAVIRATGALAAEVKVTGEVLNTSNVGAAVWGASAAASNAAGTMGEKLNDAGSASNPWTEVIESGYTAAEILRLLASVSAGKASGGGTGSIAFRDLADTKDRTVLTVDVEGNRTGVALDLD